MLFLIDVHPSSVCEKLGPKYASIPISELNKHRDFYEDLLRYMNTNFAKHFVHVWFSEVKMLLHLYSSYLFLCMVYCLLIFKTRVRLLGKFLLLTVRF